MGGKQTGDRNNPRARCVELNEFISCSICGGYLIDATTVTECLHSFCKTCIVKHLKTDNSCPRCQTLVHKTQPLRGLRSDPTLQDIVYKVVPGLYKDEMIRRKSLYQENPDAAKSITSGEERGEYSGERTIYSQEDVIPISLQYVPREITYSYQPMARSDGPTDRPDLPQSLSNAAEHGQVRFFRCVSAVTVRILKKLLRNKFDLRYHHEVQLFYKHDHLLDEYSILDLAYIYSWKRNVPLSLYYKISDLRTVTTKSATKVPAAKRKSTSGSPAVAPQPTTPLPASDPKSATIATSNGTKSPAVRPPAGRRVPPAVVPHVPLTPAPTHGPKIPVTAPITISTSPQPKVKVSHRPVTPTSQLSGLEAIRREAAAHLLKEEESTRPVTPITVKQAVTQVTGKQPQATTIKSAVTSASKQSVASTVKQPVTSSSTKQPVTPVSQLTGLEAIRREAAAHLLKEEENQRKQSQMSATPNQAPAASRTPAPTPAPNPLTQNLKRMSQLVDNIRPVPANGTAGAASAQTLDGAKKRKIVREPRGRKPKGQSNGTSSVRHRPATVRDLIVPQTPDFRTIAPAPHPFSFLYQAFLPAGKSLQQQLQQQQQQLQQLRQPVMQKPPKSLTPKLPVPEVTVEPQQSSVTKQQPGSGPTPAPSPSHVVQSLPSQGPAIQTEAKQSQPQLLEKAKSPPASGHSLPINQLPQPQSKGHVLPVATQNEKPQTALQAARQLLNIATSPAATSAATSNIFSNSELTITVTNSADASAAATASASGTKSPPTTQAVTATPTPVPPDVGLDLSRNQPAKSLPDDVSKDPVSTPAPIPTTATTTASVTSTVPENNEDDDVVIISAQKPAESPQIPCPSVI